MYTRIFLAFGLVVIFACNENSSKPYSVKDFRQTLQPVLLKTINTGIVLWDSTFEKITTDEELQKLKFSEHPVIRAMALYQILQRNEPDHDKIVKDHLEDTATIVVDRGEFGLRFMTVSDFVINEAHWKTEAALYEAIHLVISKHNYLESAYQILVNLKPDEKLYPFIKNMATRPRKLSDDGYEMNFNDIEYALCALAKFKKPEDVQVIKMVVERNQPWLTYNTLQLMSEYPDAAYFDILRQYHRRNFYNFSGYRRGGFTGSPVGNADPEDFIKALFAQRSQQSALLLDTMLLYLDHVKCMPDKERIKDGLVMKIWEDSTPVYCSIRKKVKLRAMEILKERGGFGPIELDRTPIRPPTYFRWYLRP